MGSKSSITFIVIDLNVDKCQNRYIVSWPWSFLYRHYRKKYFGFFFSNLDKACCNYRLNSEMSIYNMDSCCQVF